MTFKILFNGIQVAAVATPGMIYGVLNYAQAGQTIRVVAPNGCAAVVSEWPSGAMRQCDAQEDICKRAQNYLDTRGLCDTVMGG